MRRRVLGLARRRSRLGADEASLRATLAAGRRLVGQAEPEEFARALAVEAARLGGGDAASLLHWSEGRAGLVEIANTLGQIDRDLVIPLDRGPIGRAAGRHVPIAATAAPSDPRPPSLGPGVLELLTLPLLDQDRILGVLVVGRLDAARRFTAAEAETLNLLGGLAVAAFLGHRRARLSGVLLAARTVEHEVNNRLARTVGYCELLVADPSLPPTLAALARGALDGAQSSADFVRRLRQIARIEETEWVGLESTIDLGRSTD